MASKPRARRGYGVLIGLVLSTIGICAVTGWLLIQSFQANRQVPFGVLSGATVSTLVELDGDRAYPESITVGNDGYLYSGSFCTGEIWRIDPADGTLETWLPAGSGIEAVSGMAFAEDGTLYIVDRLDCDPRRGGASLKRILPDQTVEDWGEVTNDEILNSLVFDRDGRLFATDTQLGQVRVYDAEGKPTIWWELPNDPREPLPTGITYDAALHSMIVADSNNGSIYRIAIDDEGLPGAVELIYQSSQRSYDGITLDERGLVIFTAYDNGEVMRLERDGSTTTLARNFRNPSDVAVIGDRIFITNFDSISLTPILSIVFDPSLPFTIDVIDLSSTTDE